MAKDAPDRSPSATSCDLILVAASVITVDDARRVLEPGAVAVADGRIVAVGSPDELAGIAATRVLDLPRCAVLPGFVDCHSHLFQTLARGLGEGLPGWLWLSEFMWPYAGAMTGDDVRAAVRAGAVEGVGAGITSVLDHHYGLADADTTLDVALALETVGLRATVARGVAGPLSEVGRRQGLPASSFRSTFDEELEATRACMRERPAGGRVAVVPGPINVVYTDPDLVLACVEMAREAGVLWHTHCSAPREDPEIFRGVYGVRPVEWLAAQGALGASTTLAHATWLDDAEVGLLGETGTAIAHCPVSNQYVPYGMIRMRDLRNAGAVVGLGTDGSACGHRQDPFEQMKMSILLQRVHTLDPTASTAEEALELATREGARYLGIDAGEISVGKLADLVVVDLDRPHLTPRHRTVATIVYSAMPGDVVMTVVGGEIVYDQGRCTRVDQDEVMAEARSRAEDLIHRAGIAALMAP